MLDYYTLPPFSFNYERKFKKQNKQQQQNEQKDKIDTMALATAIYIFLNLSCIIKIISYANEYIGSLYKKTSMSGWPTLLSTEED